MLTFACVYSIATRRNNGANFGLLCCAVAVDVLTFGAGYLLGAA